VGPNLLITTAGVQSVMSDFGVIVNDNAVDCIEISDSQPFAGSILGDMRHVIRDVVCVGGLRGIHAWGGTEHRLSRVGCYRQYHTGIEISATDCFVEGCTVAAAGQVNASSNVSEVNGIWMAGANSRIYGCKVFGLKGNGGAAFSLAGAGRHEITCCEAQDCDSRGFVASGNYGCTITSCHSNANSLVGFEANAADTALNVISGCKVSNTADSGAFHHTYAFKGYAVVRGLVTDPKDATRVPRIDGTQTDIDRSMLDIDNRFGAQNLAYAATITPDPWEGQDVFVGTLTGNVTIANPASSYTDPHSGTLYPRGMLLRFYLKQDATGGRTVTFGGRFTAASAISTTANARTIISFIYDGADWCEFARSVT
jgi:hypothetical protein